MKLNRVDQLRQVLDMTHVINHSTNGYDAIKSIVEEFKLDKEWISDDYKNYVVSHNLRFGTGFNVGEVLFETLECLSKVPEQVTISIEEYNKLLKNQK